MVAGAFASATMAQNQYDALKLMENDLNGTARFVGMGGAMSALGADISTISTNPAGIGLFRGNDVSVSFGFSNNRSLSEHSSLSMKESHTKGSFDQAGFVWATKIGNRTGLRYLNVGFNYKKRANFNRQFSSNMNLNGNSLTWQMAEMLWNAGDANGTFYNTKKHLDELIAAKNPYTDENFYGTPYLAAMGFRTGLMDASLKGDKDEEPKPESEIDQIYGWNSDLGEYYSREEGGINQFDFNVSFNTMDRFYFGLTVGVYDVDYNRYSSYGEAIYREFENKDKPGEMLYDEGAFTLNNYHSTEGVGVDFKIGTIIRPFEDSPFRVGLAIHTPIWYSLTDRYYATLNTDLQKVGLKPEKYSENLSEYFHGGSYFLDYALVTPWRFNISAGTVLGGMMALDAEYEYEKYSTARLEDLDGYELNGTQAIKETLKGVHTFRVGMETKFCPEFSMRAGYNYKSAPIVSGSFKNIAATDETRTDASYLNPKNHQAVTFGLGYRGRLLYADVAYKYDFYKADFCPFDGGVDDNQTPLMEPAKITNERHQVLFTLGVRF